MWVRRSALEIKLAWFLGLTLARKSRSGEIGRIEDLLHPIIFEGLFNPIGLEQRLSISGHAGSRTVGLVHDAVGIQALSRHWECLSGRKMSRFGFGSPSLIWFVVFDRTIRSFVMDWSRNGIVNHRPTTTLQVEK
jgi:hypothetical protein